MSVLETLEICFSANLSSVTSQLNGLAAQLRGLSGQALASSGSMRSAGSALAAQMAAGFRSGLPAARSAGVQMSAGFASGVRSGGSVISSAVSSVVSAALRRMRALLEIHSPSKVTLGFGEYFSEGFARGIAGSVAMAGRAADSLSGAALAGLTSALPAEFGAESSPAGRALDALQLTVPLYVDGMKLGEASIRGINAVTKSAGRVLLNI